MHFIGNFLEYILYFIGCLDLYSSFGCLVVRHLVARLFFQSFNHLTILCISPYFFTFALLFSTFKFLWKDDTK